MPLDQDIEILDLINAIAHQATAGMQRALKDAGIGLAAMEARTLRFVSRHPGCTQSDIVRESGRDKAQIARVVKVLLERGDIARLPNEPDLRRGRLRITPEGSVSYEQAEHLRSEVAASMVGGVTAKERTQLSRLLRRVVKGSAAVK
ncbi:MULTISPECIES: MarR family winged helix-turn-helix transcriptional regulator [unclassified Lysobacter]